METPTEKSPHNHWLRIIAFFFAGIAAIYVISRVLQAVRGGSSPAPSTGGGLFEYLPPEQRALFSLVALGMLILAACVMTRILKR